jgi:hypothetical protein
MDVQNYRLCDNEVIFEECNGLESVVTGTA